MAIEATGFKTAAELQEVDSTAAEQKKKEIEEKRQKELEGSLGNKLSNFTGIDTDNFGENASATDVFGGILQVATSPLTATCNLAGGIMGADISKTNSYDNQSSGLGGLFGSVGTLFKGFGNVLGGAARAIAGPQQPPQQQKQTGKTDGSGSSSGTSDAGKTSSDKKTETGKSEKTGSSGSTGSTGSTSKGDNAEKASSSRNFTLGTLTHGSNGNITSSGSTADLKTDGYEKYNGTVRAAVEEYTEAAKDFDSANAAYEKAEKEYNDIVAKGIKGAQKDYADAKGAYDGAVSTVNNLNSKLSSISADIQGQRALLNDANLSDSRKTQIEQTIKNLEANESQVKEDLKAAEEKRDKAEVKLGEAENALSGKPASSDANKLAAAKAKMDEARATRDSALKLKEQTKEQAETAAAKAKENSEATKANREATEAECKTLDEKEQSTFVAKKAGNSAIFKSDLAKAVKADKKGELTADSDAFKKMCKDAGISEEDGAQALRVAKARAGKTGTPAADPAKEPPAADPAKEPPAAPAKEPPTTAPAKEPPAAAPEKEPPAAAPAKEPPAAAPAKEPPAANPAKDAATKAAEDAARGAAEEAAKKAAEDAAKKKAPETGAAE